MKWFATGAYGRPARREDWEAGKDFKIASGPYFSIRDKDEIRKSGCTQIEFIVFDPGKPLVTSFIVDLNKE